MAHVHHISSDENIVVAEVPVRSEFIAAKRTVYFFFDLLELVLAVRFLLQALGASMGSRFVDFIYGITDPLIRPFQGILQTAVAEGIVVEWVTLIAMLIYAVLGYFIVRLLRLLMKP